MAPKTQNTVTPAAPAAIVTRAASEIVDSRTGEVVNAGPLAPQSEALDLESLRLMNDPDFMKNLQKAAAAKKEDFKALDKDFWSPGAAGTADAVLQGIYMGSAKDGRLVQHAIAVVGSKGQPVLKRVNGTHALTNALTKQCKPSDKVRIEYMGDKTSQGLVSGQGQKFKEWEVTKLEG